MSKNRIINIIGELISEPEFKEIYDFLRSINLVRFIDTLIIDGFENLNDILIIQSDYFEENKAFNKNQQKKFLNKIKEIKERQAQNKQKDKPKTSEMSIGCNLEDKKLPIKICWNFLNIFIAQMKLCMM